MTPVFTYEGFVLDWLGEGRYRSSIAGHEMDFKTVSEWKQLIDKLQNGKKKKTNHRREHL